MTLRYAVPFAVALLAGCPATGASNDAGKSTDMASATDAPASTNGSDDTGTANPQDSEVPAESASVTAVSVSGDPGGYSFSVTIASPDTGCDQYADWWEVVDADGALVYRRILAHSHVDEQPFTRSGGPADVQPDDELTVRMHMNTTGYSTAAMRGTVTDGFDAVTLDDDFAASLESVDPQPSGCAF